MENKLESKTIPIKKLATGDDLSINVIEIEGNGGGPTCYIQASVHGAEIQGNLVIKQLLDFFKTTYVNGKLIIIPNANPYATIQKSGPYTQGRFNPVTGNNFNRNYTDLFASTEGGKILDDFIKNNSSDEKLSQKFKDLISLRIDSIIKEKSAYGLSDDFYLNIMLQKLASQADICLDLHTGPIACEYLYSNHSQKEEVIKQFPFEFVLSIPEEFAGAMDEAFFINYTRLNKKLSEQNRKKISCSSYTVELGSEEHFDTNIAHIYTQKILYFLSAKGLIDKTSYASNPNPKEIKYIDLKNYKTYYAPTGGHVEYLVSPGNHVQKGDKLASLYVPTFDETGFKKHDIFAQEDSWIINYQNSSTVHEGMELLQVGEKAEIHSTNNKTNPS